MNKKQLIRLLGWATLLTMGGTGVLILKYIQGLSLKEFFKFNPEYLKIGALYGIVAGFFGHWIYSYEVHATGEKILFKIHTIIIAFAV